MPPRVRSSAPPEVATTPRASRRVAGDASTVTPASGRSSRRNHVVAPVVSADHPSQRAARERKPRTTFSPSAQGPKRKYTRRLGDAAESALSSGVADDDLAPDERCRRLEARVRSYIKQLRYLQTFLDAYEAEGWRRASREKLKPSKEIATARRKMTQAKRRVVEALHAINALRQRDPQIPYLIEMETQPAMEAVDEEGVDDDANADRIVCSRCASTVTTEDNDILLCDSEGCFRAFHQQCQIPSVRTQDIPQGDEPWFCASCLAIFNALKAINYACDTTHEKIDDVFPDLVEEEQSLAADGEYSASAAEGTADEDDASGAPESEDDEEDDEDFVVDEADPDTNDASDNDVSDSSDASGDTSADDGVVEYDVSDDELHHLHKDDVIDSNRRSMRSHGGRNDMSQGSSKKSYLGERVAKRAEDGSVVFGVVVEKEDANTNDTDPRWRVVYFDDTVSHLGDGGVIDGIELAAEHEALHSKAHRRDKQEDVDPSLIVRGKRKRSRVDYRALNDLMFDGKEDSDAGDDEHVENESEEEEDDSSKPTNGDDQDDEDFEPPKATASTTTVAAVGVKRGRRERRAVDYRAMHEGVASD